MCFASAPLCFFFLFFCCYCFYFGVSVFPFVKWAIGNWRFQELPAGTLLCVFPPWLRELWASVDDVG